MITKTVAVTLIATIAIFAKAEPSVYFCNTTEYAQVTDDGVANVKSYPFKLFVDLEQRKIKMSGDITPVEILHNGQGSYVTPWLDVEKGEDAFFARNVSTLLDFQNGQLAHARLGKLKDGSSFSLSSFLASCDKF